MFWYKGSKAGIPSVLDGHPNKHTAVTGVAEEGDRVDRELRWHLTSGRTEGKVYPV